MFNDPIKAITPAEPTPAPTRPQGWHIGITGRYVPIAGLPPKLTPKIDCFFGPKDGGRVTVEFENYTMPAPKLSYLDVAQAELDEAAAGLEETKAYAKALQQQAVLIAEQGRLGTALSRLQDQREAMILGQVPGDLIALESLFHEQERRHELLTESLNKLSAVVQRARLAHDRATKALELNISAATRAKIMAADLQAAERHVVEEVAFLDGASERAYNLRHLPQLRCKTVELPPMPAVPVPELQTA